MEALYAKSRTPDGKIVVGGWLSSFPRVLFALALILVLTSIVLFYLGNSRAGGISLGIAIFSTLGGYAAAKFIAGVLNH